jgi:hypothetical protein
MGKSIRNRRRLLVLLLVCGASVCSASVWAQNRPSYLKMPGQSYRGPLAALTEQQVALREALKTDVTQFATKIGERNAVRKLAALNRAADYIQQRWNAAGQKAQIAEFTSRGVKCRNIWCQRKGTRKPEEIVLIGAHYDSAIGSPAANDNGSGIAALLCLGKEFAEFEPERTLKFVAFTNEEQPYFQRNDMGSYVHAAGCRKRKDNIVAMLSLETIGYYSDRPGSQSYPATLRPYFPTTGNFIAFVGNTESEKLVKQVTGSFRQHAKFPSEGAALPAGLPGVGWSDHWSFWQFGYPAAMVTDTALFRYPHYHKATDTPDKIDFAKLARVVDGLRYAIEDLTRVR